MPDKNKIIHDLQYFERLDSSDKELIQKLDEVMVLLELSKIDTENIRGIKLKLNEALDKKLSRKDLITEIKEVSLSSDMDKMAQLDELEMLLNTHHLDSKQAKGFTLRATLIRGVKVMLGLMFVVLGFSMIILPAPPYFEMYVIFNFTPDDGVTLMDVISLIIILAGIYIILTSIKPKQHE
ncbi:hypothetical protein [Pedobacter sp. GR22-6]|uniref:hypothetical protein n=1 Tax=Pedobacter sp. GR22-6 TaxID=3127957 RepID=UPI00307FC5B2